MISTMLYSDPACPWAYSESPALRVLEWRYGSQLSWRLVVVGLTESASQYERRGHTPVRGALGQVRFRRFGMPFAPAPKSRLSATARACRAVVATRLAHPGREWAVFRALQLANFTTPLLLDDDEQLAGVLRSVPEIDAEAIISRLDAPEVTEAYERDRAETRSAAGSPAELQGKTATTDGPVRFTAP
ncbi:MAG: DsbA family protein, partial [Solirubrobacterales bacterium]|nr:DsbA family protein [Solirubrobacterales bacterium]